MWKRGHQRIHRAKSLCPMRHLLMMLLLACSLGCAALTPADTLLPHRPILDDSVLCNFDEEQPEFPGGTKAMRKFLSDYIRYPDAAVKHEIQGKVYCGFVVNTDGSLSDFNVLKGIGYGCDEEAIRLLRLMPTWKPGKRIGKPVRVKYNLPISFLLTDRQKFITSPKPLND